jgi:dolichyl-phosphate beta-glucosyltransferase
MSLKRRLFSVLFRQIIRIYLDIPAHLTDTQCGFKMYDGDTARELYSEPTLDGFLFDVEIILRAVKAGYGITEFPIQWAWDPDSRLQPNRIYGQIIRELLYLKRTY